MATVQVEEYGPGGQRISGRAVPTPDPTALDTNTATVLQRVDAGIAAMQAWVANNPNGATLNAAQTLALVKMINGLAKIVRGQLTDTAGT